MKKYLFAIIVTLLTVGIVLWFIPLERIPEIPKQIKIRGIILGFIFYLVSYIAVSARWGILFSEGMKKRGIFSLLILFPMTASHQFMANILPARAGDLTIVYLAKKKLNIDPSLAMSSLIIARAFDVMILGVLAFVFIILHHENSLLFHPGATTVALLFVSIPVLGIVTCIFKGKKIAGWLNRKLLPYFQQKHWAWGERVALFLERTALLLSIRRSVFFYIKCITITIGIMLLRIVYLSMFALHAVDPVPFKTAPLIGLSTLIASATPIQGFLGLGAFEGGWVLGYVLSGLSPERGILTGAGAHLLIMMFILLSGILGNLILLKKGRDDQ
jgi:uncharacterized protein (TIRG00374 family)